MRALWQVLARTIFWSYDRGTWPYDLAVALIVLFVLLSPRSWFNDQPSAETMTATASLPAMVELRGADPVDGAAIYRVDARLISREGGDLAQQLRQVVRKHAYKPPRGSPFEVLRFTPVLGRDGVVAYYDVCVTP
jgi:hypothetical protein